MCKLLDTHNTNAAHVAQYIPGYFDVHTNDFGLPFSNMTSAKDNLLERPPDSTTGNNTNETQTPTNDPFHRPSDPIPTQLQHELTKCSDGDRYVKFSQHIALTSTVDPTTGITLDPKSAAAYLYSAHANQNMFARQFLTANPSPDFPQLMRPNEIHADSAQLYFGLESSFAKDLISVGRTFLFDSAESKKKKHTPVYRTIDSFGHEAAAALKNVASLNTNDHDAKVAALHSSVIDAGCYNARTHPMTSTWTHSILDPGQRAHANIQRGNGKNLNGDGNGQVHNIIPDGVFTMPRTDRRTREHNDRLHITDHKTLSLCKTNLGWSAESDERTCAESLRKKLLRKVNESLTDKTREENRDPKHPKLKDRWKQKGATASKPKSTRTREPVSIARAMLAIEGVFTEQKLDHHFDQVRASNKSKLDKNMTKMDQTYWPGEGKGRIAAELKRHGGMHYLMNGPWNETSREYYKTVSTIAGIATHEECKRGIEQDWDTTHARHIRFHAKLIGCAGTLATSIRRIEAMKYAAYNKADAEKVVKAATHGNTKASYYKWSPSALDVDRMKEHELYHSAPFRH